MLETLERANLFVVPLDDRREWYRYHHLFADVLSVRAARRGARSSWPCSTAGRATGTSATASELRPSRHALAAEDFSRAADLIELAVPAMRQARQEATLRGWFEALPPEVFANRPVLSIGLVGARMASGSSTASRICSITSKR